MNTGELFFNRARFSLVFFDLLQQFGVVVDPDTVVFYGVQGAFRGFTASAVVCELLLQVGGVALFVHA